MLRPLLPLGLAVVLTVGCLSSNPPPEVPVLLSLESDGRASLGFPPSGVALRGLTVRVKAGGVWHAFAKPVLELRGDESVLVYSSRHAAILPASVELTVLLPGRGGRPISDLVRLEPRIIAGARGLGVDAFELSLPAGGVELPLRERAQPEPLDELVFWQHGYQSWSFTGPVRLVAPFASPLDQGDEALRGGLGDPVHEKRGVGWWYGALAAKAGAPVLLIGAGAATKRRTAIVPSLPTRGQPGLIVRVGTTDETQTVAAGATLVFEPLLLGAHRESSAAFEHYIEALRATLSPLVGAGTTAPEVDDVTGWWSWNIFFEQVTETQVLDHARYLHANLAQRGFGLVVLDDGYEQRWGDWEDTDPVRFPSGLDGLAEKVRVEGLAIGLWLAPFLVDEESDLFKTHPEWFVQGDDGQALRHTQLGVRGTTVVLDPTHPGAAAHLDQLFARLAGYGYGLFKLDFLYAGALPGKRHEAGVTGIEALHRGLELVRQGAPKAHINLCGMPILPAVGRGHSLRVGADVAFGVAPVGFGQVAHEARNVFQRAHLAPLFRIDPDQALVREPHTLDEARVAATIVALTGFYTSGDDLTKLPAERRAVLETGHEIGVEVGTLRPLDPLGDASDVIYVSPLGDPGLWSNNPRTVPPSRVLSVGGQTRFLALFNWSTKARRETVDLDRLFPGAPSVQERWSGKAYLGPSFELELAPHSVALLEVLSRK